MNSKLLIKYVNKWIALTPDRKKVLASAANIKELEKKVDKIQSKPDVVYHHVLPTNGNYLPQWQIGDFRIFLAL